MNKDEKCLISGRNNLAVTLFVPWDCGNNCPFCTTKQEYQDPSSFSLSKQINTLYQIWGIDDVQDIVITGGEPLADLDGLHELLTAISSMSMLKKKNVYINTSKHELSGDEAIRLPLFCSHFKNIIKGFNLSQHISFNLGMREGRLLDVLHKCNIPVKLNCVLTGNEDYRDLFEFVFKWQKEVDTISFRRDYRTVLTDDDLRGEDITLLTLEEIFGNYTSGGCAVCNDDVFKGGKVRYHRGKENTLIEEPEHFIVNDIIIKQDGSLYLDWNKQHPIMPIDLLNRWWAKTTTDKRRIFEAMHRAFFPKIETCGGSGSCGSSCGHSGRTGYCGSSCGIFGGC